MIASGRQYFLRQSGYSGYEVSRVDAPGAPVVSVMRGLSSSVGGQLADALAKAFEAGIEGTAADRLGVVNLRSGKVHLHGREFSTENFIDEEQRCYGVCRIRTGEGDLIADETLATAWTPGQADLFISALREAYAEGTQTTESI